MSVEQRLLNLGLVVPDPPSPAGHYRPWTVAGSFLYLSGQFPIQHGELRWRGRVGAELSEEQGSVAAQLAALNVLAQIRAALGGFDRLGTLVRLEGHVASAPGWKNAPKILDAASELFVRVLDQRGEHARTAFNPPGLPLNSPIELVVTALLLDD